ncbi:HAD family hydrolase [Streptomyces abikoensis]|uniref:HAD family hydrolase n=1 Tax=Streptomyces abikoensis TaxID=97398 RepID=UPI00368605B1
MCPLARVPERVPDDDCPVLPPRIRAVVLDADSVLTDLVHVQAATWTFVLDDYLCTHAPGSGAAGPDPQMEVARFLDGSHLLSAVTSFLEARGLPVDSFDEAARITHDLAVHQQEMLRRYLRHYGIGLRRGTAGLLTALRAQGIACAAVSGTARARGLLVARGVLPLLDVVLDGDDQARLRLPTRPDPALLYHAARLLGAGPRETAVVDASPYGVAAAARGGFGRVVGLTPAGDVQQMTEMFRHGADVVVHDLDELGVRSGLVGAAA